MTSPIDMAREALEPFATWAADNTDSEGWAGNLCEGDRVRDWFGPSEFRAARTAYQALASLPEQDRGL